MSEKAISLSGISARASVLLLLLGKWTSKISLSAQYFHSLFFHDGLPFCREDVNFQFLIVFRLYGVDDQEDQGALYPTCGMPSLFSIDHAVLLDQA
jgi:hypothetical protein